MFTATKDLTLPTTVTGSWPRPRWFTDGLWGRQLSTVLMDVAYREQFLDALSAVITDQDSAGLDIVTNGDYFLDEDFAGRSWHHYALQRWKGLSGDYLTPRWEQLEFPPGTLLHEIYTTWRWPNVIDRIEYDPERPLEYAKVWRLAQARSRKPVKFGVCSGQVYSFFLDGKSTDAYKDDDDKRQMIWDMATAVNTELRQAAAAGCKVIQIEDPVIHYAAFFNPADADRLDFLVDATNHEMSGLENVEVWLHTCWGNPNMQRVYETTVYEPKGLELYLERTNADVITVEMKDRNFKDIENFKPFRDTLKKKVAVGVVSHRGLQVETPEEVAQDVRRAMQYINPEKLILSSDCGFGRQGCNRTIAFYKAAAIAQGANVVRRELGLPETEVRAADPALQMDAPIPDPLSPR